MWKRLKRFTRNVVVLFLFAYVIGLPCVVYAQARIEKMILTGNPCLFHNIRAAVMAYQNGHHVKVIGGEVTIEDDEGIKTMPHVWVESDGKVLDLTVPAQYVIKYRPFYSYVVSPDFTFGSYLKSLKLERSLLNPIVSFNLLVTYAMTKGSFDTWVKI